MYIRLFAGILDSSLMETDVDARWLFIVMLFLGDKHRDGVIDMPISRLSATAALSEERTAAALTVLTARDTRSSSPEEDGRRIVSLDGRQDRGWMIVNYRKYKNILKEEDRKLQVAENVRRWRARKAAAEQPLLPPVIIGNQPKSSVIPIEVEADKEEEESTAIQESTPVGFGNLGKKEESSASKTKTDPPFFDEASPEMKAARHLAARIRENDEKAKAPNFRAWAADFEKLFRIDGRDPGEVAELINWCQADDFWKSNILSAATFRKKYPKLRLQAESRQTPPAAAAMRVVEQERKTE